MKSSVETQVQRKGIHRLSVIYIYGIRELDHEALATLIKIRIQFTQIFEKFRKSKVKCSEFFSYHQNFSALQISEVFNLQMNEIFTYHDACTYLIIIRPGGFYLSSLVFIL
jgi:hypothetical protein